MILEWVLLGLVTAAVLVPVVLLGGFVGCGFEGDNCDDPPLAPTSFTASWDPAIDGVFQGGASLTWMNPNPSTVSVRFEIERRKVETQPELEIMDLGYSTSHLDLLQDPDATYTYRVRASRIDVNDCSSEWSNEVSISTPFAAAYGGPFAPLPITPQSGVQGWCIVQRLEPEAFVWGVGRTRVRLVLVGSSLGQLEVNKITISEGRPEGGAGDPYDSVTPPTVVETAVIVPPAPAMHTTSAVDYPFNPTRPLLIAFEIGSPGNVAHAPVLQSRARAYYKVGGVNEAETADRWGYTLAQETEPGTSRVYLVATVEVA
jgi:hypothetical protein